MITFRGNQRILTNFLRLLRRKIINLVNIDAGSTRSIVRSTIVIVASAASSLLISELPLLAGQLLLLFDFMFRCNFRLEELVLASLD